MLGAVCGDIAGSRHEFHPLPKSASPWDFELFTERNRYTDDSVLTFAIAKALMTPYASDEELKENIVDNFHEFARMHPNGGYGGRFFRWLAEQRREPYNSFGNGSAMRVSPVGWIADSLEETERLAKLTADVTHNHPEGVKGACSVAGAIFLARNGKSKEEIKEYLKSKYGYDLDRTLAEIQPGYRFDETCQGSVPEALVAFLESENYEDAIRKAIWLGGDADTQAAIAGSIAEAFYGIPDDLRRQVEEKLPPDLREVYDNWQKFIKR
ncbi:MAG: ADP-ribosylglycohydrolase family protein [Desulfovibrio sp.]|nr:ADP-ribosylglycohydrolase family protein [Desulfovibrio sp.]